jgi:hypothetical protein
MIMKKSAAVKENIMATKSSVGSLITMNNFYIPNITVVIFKRAIYTRETGKEEGWKFKNRRFGLGRVVRSLFKTD